MRQQVGALDAQLNQLIGLVAGAALFQAFRGAFDRRDNVMAPEAGCLPPPNQDLASAPAGKGLQTNPEGWPQGSVRTAGGYTVVPEGKDAAWKIYGPEQNPGDKAMTRVWGDPHVDEADGQRWDFTKSSNFRLPDGTVIDVRTTSETGQSVTNSLNIVNGSDRVSINGINENRPKLSEVTRDGFDYRARLQAENPNRDTFVLGGTGKEADGNDRVQWARERGGIVDGVISGTVSNVDGKGSYGQQIDGNRKFTIDRTLRPDPISNPEAWGNMLRGELADAAGFNLTPEQRQDAVRELNDSDAMNRFRSDAQRRLARATGEQQVRPFNDLFRGEGANQLDSGLNAARALFSMMFQQLELSNVLGQTLQRNRGLFV